MLHIYDNPDEGLRIELKKAVDVASGSNLVAIAKNKKHPEKNRKIWHC
jgi:hypothetical protein